MENVGIWLVAGLVFAGFGGMYISMQLYKNLQKRKAAAVALGMSFSEAVYLWFSGGVPLLMSLAGLLLKIPVVREDMEKTCGLISEDDTVHHSQALLSVLLLAAVVVAAIVALVLGSIVTGIAVGCAVCLGLLAYFRSRVDKEELAMREDVPDALRSMSTCFRSGLSLVQTLKQTSTEVSPALAKLFRTAQYRLEMGATPTEALDVFRHNEAVPELAFVSVALDVQHQSGGSIAPVLESATDSVSSELDLMRSLRVQTAQAKLSAGIVTVMPFVLIALFSLMSPGFLSPFFESFVGFLLLAVALLMQAAGVLCVRHMLKINGG